MGAGYEALAFDVTYLEGDPERIRATMRARLEVERRWPPGHDIADDGKITVRPAPPSMEAILLVAWWSKHSPAEFDQAKFDEWAATVESIQEQVGADAKGEPVDPSRPAATDV